MLIFEQVTKYLFQNWMGIQAAFKKSDSPTYNPRREYKSQTSCLKNKDQQSRIYRVRTMKIPVQLRGDAA